MSYLALDLISSLTGLAAWLDARFLALFIILAIAAFMFLIQMGLRHADQKNKDWVIDFAGVGLIIGLASTSGLALVLLPTPAASLVLLPIFHPHALFILLWCAFTLAVIRRKYGPKLMLPALALLYGLSEVFFNAMVYLLSHALSVPVPFFDFLDWQIFFGAIVTTVAVCYCIVRPKFTYSPAILLFLAYCLIWSAKGVPSIDDSLTGMVQNVPWDIAWQFNMFMFGTWVMKPR